jgi:hypothetical protein
MFQKIIFTIFLLLFMFPSVNWAGSSLFGFGPKLLGEWQYQYSSAALGRGGYEMAVNDSMNINQTNFSLWTLFSRTTFSINMRYQNLSSTWDSDESSSTDANFSGGFIAMPLIKRKFSIGFGLTPYSLNEQGIRITDIGVGEETLQTIKSSGTLTEAKFVAAYAISQKISFALVTNYNFGSIADDILIEVPTVEFGNIEIENRYRIYGLSLGTDFFFKLSEKLSTGFRIRYPAKFSLAVEQESLNTLYTIDEQKEINMPLNWTAGFALTMSDRWQVGADFDYQHWRTGYKFDNSPVENMENSFRLGMGIERNATSRIFDDYFQHMILRGGLFFGQLNILENKKSINEYGISLGFSLPIQRLRHRLDVAVQYGKRGNLESNQASESYLRFNLSLSTNELWFVPEE